MKYIDYKEAKKHGTVSFPLQYYYVDKAHPEYIMPLHWHGETEILRVLEGELDIWLNTERLTVKAGEIIFIEGGALHRAEPKSCKYECAVFDPQIASGQIGSRLSELITPLCSGQAHLDVSCEAANAAAGQLLAAAKSQEPFYELKIASLICELVMIFYKEGALNKEKVSGKRTNRRRATITVLLEKIERDYAEKISIADLAAIAGINEKYLCRFFKEVTGHTPTDYINRVRVEHACREMKFNHRNVTEAAYECGFNEIGYFYKCFKKYKGVPPGKYR